MQVLFDNGVPRGVAAVLKEHVVEEARDRVGTGSRTATYSGPPKSLGSSCY